MAGIDDHPVSGDLTPVDPQIDALRLPPHSLEAEQSVLGGLLLDNSAWDRVADMLTASDFYRDDHRENEQGREAATGHPSRQGDLR